MLQAARTRLKHNLGRVRGTGRRAPTSPATCSFKGYRRDLGDDRNQ